MPKPSPVRQAWRRPMLAILLAAIAPTSRADGPLGSSSAPRQLAPDAADRDATYALPAEDPWSPVPPQRREDRDRLVFKDRIEPHWIDGGDRVWYRNDLPGGSKEFILVDATAGTRGPAFDHDRLADALSDASGSAHLAERLPFETLDFLGESNAIRFQVDEQWWSCDLESYECSQVDDDAVGPGRGEDRDQHEPRRSRGGRRGGDLPEEAESPDETRVAFVEDHNVFVRLGGDGEPIQLSTDGEEGNSYGRLSWSPDSKTLAAFRIEPGDREEVHLIQSSPPEGGRAQLTSRPYDLPGDKLTTFELSLFDIEACEQIKPEVERLDYGWPRLRWSEDGRRLSYEKVDRGHQRFRLIEVDARSGEARALIDERAETFIWTAHAEALDLRPVTYLDQSNELIYATERSGWRHLELIDAETGAVRNPITSGEFVVRGIDHVDEDARQVWFHAGGMNEGQDPYFLHHYRVNFDGTGLVALTEGDGNHSVQFSPDRRFLIDTYSRVDMAPVHELRRTCDGSLVLRLEEADASALLESGWEAPEVFVARGRDGKTDIWGIICRPKVFDPDRSYPVIEHVYAGPQGAFVPKSFSEHRRFSPLTDLGFVVVQIDGMGTAHRSKAFHDVCWQDLKDGGFPDRIAWHRAAAEKFPWYDLGRVGIYGGSAGGQNATAALLFHPEFYKVGVSGSGCHDNRMDKASWNEQWMGYPVGSQYAESSNIDHAHRLRGKLLLIVGELDSNVPPESTLRLADALIRADKDFDYLVVPNAGHGMGGRYGQRRLEDFFVRHLLGVEPPDRNAEPPGDSAVARASSVDSPRPLEADADADPAPVDLDELVDDPSPLRAPIERYVDDLGSLRRSAPPDESPERDALLRRFHEGWRSRLGSLDFEALGPDGQIDYLLFRNHLDHQLRDLGRRSREREQAEPLVPFGRTILDLEASRRELEPMDWAKVAGRVDRLAEEVDDALRALEDRSSEEDLVEPPVAERAAGTAQDLRRTFRGWFEFYDGYDPVFSWWMRQPYGVADEALERYEEEIRTRLGAPDRNARGGQSRRAEQDDEGDPDGEIVGTPIGRDALLAELEHEMISYSPEELIDLAEEELAWCEAQMGIAATDLGFGDDWRAALEHVKRLHVPPGDQPRLIRDLALGAIAYLDEHDLVTIPPLARDSWRMEMMSPERQLVNPFFLGGEAIIVSYPTDSMAHDAKLMSMRGNNEHFARATVHHEVIPGHHLQGFMTARYNSHRRPFSTPFWGEGWALYWELLLWDRGFARSAEDRVGMLFWRMHRCARIIFSLKFHLGELTPQECIDLLVDRVGHEPANAEAEVRRSVATNYGPLYQAAYLLGGLQLRALHRELVESGTMTDRAFHDAVLRQNSIPIELLRARLTGQDLSPDFEPDWRFYDGPPEDDDR
ncbi:DUF885 family protein [Tautonia plasticadhaerens]|uniref:Prolyl tripeptidyl peptidase n=1 Tax=Tautonia plasticadhaerens TaxID=2527974 RepID=A0A518GVK5_9BACT|nr:DUF885 family protein [Tautonia plasticadhaerens]QDV32588.1 Prolyl tripeptidyl peptidase precursor [Tautonia plasticadhaerens]